MKNLYYLAIVLVCLSTVTWFKLFHIRATVKCNRAGSFYITNKFNEKAKSAVHKM